MMKYLLPCLLVMIVVGLILALTKAVVWSVFYFIVGLSVFTFLCASVANLFVKGKSYYVITPKGILRDVCGVTRRAYYENIKSIKVRKSLFNKDCGSINFKLYNGSGINLEFVLLKNLNQTYDYIRYFWERNKNVNQFDRIFTDDFWCKCEDFASADSVNLERFPVCLRVYYVMYCLYDAMSETGFDEFFINEKECSAPYLLECCEYFGMAELTDICTRAVKLNERYGIDKNQDLPEECVKALDRLNEEFDMLDSSYDLMSMVKDYYIRDCVETRSIS